jgi:hypothetical protein
MHAFPKKFSRGEQTMEPQQLEQLEQKLSVLEAGNQIYQVIVGLATRVDELGAENALLAEAFLQMAQILHGMAALDRQQRAELKAQQDALTKRRRPEPEPESGGGGQVN